MIYHTFSHSGDIPMPGTPPRERKHVGIPPHPAAKGKHSERLGPIRSGIWAARHGQLTPASPYKFCGTPQASLAGTGKDFSKRAESPTHKAQMRIFMHIFQPTTCGTFAKVRTYSHKSQQISRFLCKPVTFCRFLLYTSPKMIFSRGAYPFIMPRNPDMVHTLGTAEAPHAYGNSGACLGNSNKEAVVVRRGNTPPDPDI